MPLLLAYLLPKRTILVCSGHAIRCVDLRWNRYGACQLFNVVFALGASASCYSWFEFMSHIFITLISSVWLKLGSVWCIIKMRWSYPCKYYDIVLQATQAPPASRPSTTLSATSPLSCPTPRISTQKSWWRSRTSVTTIRWGVCSNLLAYTITSLLAIRPTSCAHQAGTTAILWNRTFVEQQHGYLCVPSNNLQARPGVWPRLQVPMACDKFCI